MRLRETGMAVAIGALAFGAAACEQASIDCRTARGSFAATYTLKEGAGPCSELKGDRIGMQSYYPELEGTGKVDLSWSTLAIRTASIGRLDDEVKRRGVTLSEPLYSLGEFASMTPDSSGQCSVPSLSPTDVSVPAIPPEEDPLDPENPEPGVPATGITYTWSDVRLVVTPTVPGTRMTAELTYTENGCAAKYSVAAVWPAVRCEKLTVDESGKVVGMRQPEEKLCDSEPDPEPPYNRPTGSRINPDFKVHCDPDLFLCVLDAEP